MPVETRPRVAMPIINCSDLRNLTWTQFWEVVLSYLGELILDAA